MSRPTQVYGHTIYLVLSYGLPIFSELCDTVFSDHMPVFFEAALACDTFKPCAAARHCRIINPSTAVQFSVAFNQNTIIPEFVCNTEELGFTPPAKCFGHCGSIKIQAALN